jgi:hypothetical protein
MNYIIIPSQLIQNIPQSILDELNILFKYSKDKSKIIIHIKLYDKLFNIEHIEDKIFEYPYPIYRDLEIQDILLSEEWN